MSTKIQSKTLTHFLTREAPLIAIEAWYNGRMYKFTEYTGITYPTTLFMHKNKTFRFYIDLDGFEEKLPQDLSLWIKNNENKFRKTHNKMSYSLVKLKEIRNSSLKTGKELLEAARKTSKLWGDMYIGVLISHHLAMFHEKFMENGIRIYDDNIVNEAIKWRKEEGNIFFNEGVETISKLLDKIAKIKKCDREDLRHLTLKELEDFIKKGIFQKNEIRFRKNFPYIYFRDRVIHKNHIGRFLGKFGCRLGSEERITNFSEVKGSVANKGNARGTARIITNRGQLKKFQDKDVIVAHMTSPWYLPILRKASAIVTDEGGVTCHAAIISREFDVPCIVGCRIATRVLEDGDLVEVDANNGVVRKLNGK